MREVSAWMWRCKQCQQYVPTREVFQFAGFHWHWAPGEELCGPLEIVEIEDSERVS